MFNLFFCLFFSVILDIHKELLSLGLDRGFSDDEEEAEFTSGEEEGQDMSDSEPIRNKLPHTRVSLFQ